MVSYVSKRLTMLSSIRLLIADDDAAIRAALRQLLHDHYEVVGEAENGLEAVEAAEHLRPDIVLLDISMPVMGGLPAARRMKSSLPEVRIIFVSHHPEPAYIKEAFSSGANGYVLKRLVVSDLEPAIQEVAAGRNFRSAT